MRQVTVIALSLLTALSLNACDSHRAPEEAQPSTSKRDVLSHVPNPVDRAAYYLIYLHGAIIESQGMEAVSEQYGRYEYAAILNAFADRGFTVISEARPPGTRPDVYARQVATQVRSLLDGGVPESRITVVGFSKGGVIALLASQIVGRPDVNWVIQAGCGPWVDKMPALVPVGRMLSQVDGSDTLAGSCSDLFRRMSSDAVHREEILDLGLGHGSFYSVKPEWFEDAVRWGGR